MKIVRDGIAVVRERAGIAPAVARAIVPARACQSCNLPLNEYPAVARLAQVGFQNYRWGPLTGTVQVQRSSADVHRTPDLRKPCVVAPYACSFINQSRSDEY